MRLEAGKKYVLRDGEITPPIRLFCGGPFYDVYGWSVVWNSDGEEVLRHLKTKDIIREYKPYKVKW